MDGRRRYILSFQAEFSTFSKLQHYEILPINFISFFWDIFLPWILSCLFSCKPPFRHHSTKNCNWFSQQMSWFLIWKSHCRRALQHLWHARDITHFVHVGVEDTFWGQGPLLQLLCQLHHCQWEDLWGLDAWVLQRVENWVQREEKDRKCLLRLQKPNSNICPAISLSGKF